MRSLTPIVSESLRQRERRAPGTSDCFSVDDGTGARADLYHRLFEDAAGAMAIVAPDGCIVKANTAFCDLLVRSASDLVGQRLDGFVHTDQNAELKRHLNAFGEGDGAPFRATLDFVTPRGDHLQGVLILSVIKDAYGRATCLLAQLIEIGSLLQPHLEFEESHRRFKALSEATFEAVLISCDGTCVDANRTAVEMLGMPRETIIGMKTADLFAPPSRALVQEKMGSGCETAYRAMALKAGGDPFHVMIQAKMVSIGKRTVRVSVVRDIDGQVRTEAALRESERHLRSLLESASHFVLFRFCHNPDNPCEPRRIFISPSIREIVDDHRVHDFQSFLGTFHPEDRQRMIDAAANLRDSQRMDIRVRVEDRSGTGWRWLHIIAVAVCDMAAKHTFYNGIIIDITGERAATAALKKRERELKERTESLSEVNTALEVLLRKREADRMEVEERMLNNARGLILPYLEKLKVSRLDDRQRIYLNLVESNLNEIISPLAQRMSHHYMNFTPMEIQVANLVKEGKTTKEIAYILGVSNRTIEAVRYAIRRKLGLKKKRNNLRSYLLSIDVT